VSTLLGPNGTCFARCHFRAQKSLDFQGPLLSMALVMYVACIKIITSRAIKTTGTLIVIGVFGDIFVQQNNPKCVLFSTYFSNSLKNFLTFSIYAKILSLSSENTQKELRIRRGKFLLSKMPDEFQGIVLIKTLVTWVMFWPRKNKIQILLYPFKLDQEEKFV
jgi:hypothetical protein